MGREPHRFRQAHQLMGFHFGTVVLSKNARNDLINNQTIYKNSWVIYLAEDEMSGLWPPEVSPCAASEKQTSSSLRRRLDALMPAIMILSCQRKGNLRNQRRNLCQSLVPGPLFSFVFVSFESTEAARTCVA